MRRISQCFLVLVILAAPAAAAAQEPSPEQARVLENLSCLVGTWTGEGTVQMGDTEHSVSFAYTCRAAAAGAGVTCHLEMTGIPGFTYEANDLWGYDPGTNSVHWFTVSNAGETHDHRGRIDGRSFFATYVGRREGQPMRENVRFAFTDQNSVSFSSVVYVAHTRIESFSGSMTKERPRSARATQR